MQFIIENSILQMSVVHSKLKEYYISADIEEEVANKISIAIDEVVSNIILYGYEDNEIHQISIYLESKPAFCSLKFIDDGKYFDPLEYLKANTKTRDLDQFGGVGLNLIHNLSSEIKYERQDHKNILVITIPY